MTKVYMKRGNKSKRGGDKITVLEKSISTTGSYKLKELKKGDKIPIISDAMFNAMLNNENKKQYVSLIISEVLKVSYKEIYESIIFVKEKLDKERIIELGKEVDLVCKINNEIVGIEMNNNPSKRSLERNISYAADLYKSKMIKGKAYEYNKVVQININNFTFGNEETINEYYLRDNKGEIFTDKIRFIHIYLPNIRKKGYNRLNRLEKLMLVLNEEKEKSIEIALGDEIMEEYVKDAMYTSSEDEIIGLYDKELHLEKLHLSDIEDAKEEALKQGKEEGIKEDQKRIINNMISKGLTIDEVSLYTDISKEEIEKLIN